MYNVKKTFEIFPVGIVHKQDSLAEIEIYSEFTPALLGLEAFSHIIVLYWFHENDTPKKRSTLRVHPRKNAKNPLTGVFGTHAPVRPNLIAMSVCKILAVTFDRIRVEAIDAFDQSPVIDIKGFFPDTEPVPDFKLPDWA